MSFYSAIFLALFACTASAAKTEAKKEIPKKEKDPVFVVTQAVEKKEFYQTVNFASNIKPYREVQVFSYIDGTIAKKFVKNGTYVKAGQKIAAVKNIQPGFNYANHEVLAPISGVVSGFDEEIGTLISKSKPLVSLADQSRLRITVPVRQEDLNILYSDNFRIKVRPLGFKSGFSAKIHNISPNVDPVMGTTTVIFELTEKDKRIRPGMIAKVNLQHGLNSALGIEEKYISDDPYKNKKYIFRVSKEMTAQKAYVETGAKRDGLVEILKGLEQGQLVVTKSAEELEEGDPVTDEKKTAEVKTEKRKL